ncbi:unnamed protein product [Pseudo-nitzschia multistriata]|uniref:Uncharacterized protein n=1 Tax=Pseudo-nitzschia multistriata TaxID=183589 RepID=A0A448Z3K0_9STRA|nr:unnamed protein product [Pseudo-nitzschia multistriata]
MDTEEDLLNDVDDLHDDLGGDDECKTETMEGSENENESESVVDECIRLDCYPYSFSPLLLFAPGGYFDKGYSNYNAVARYFSPAIGSNYNMLENVVYDRKNMQYDELLNYVMDRHCLVVCCIDAHFTAFQFLGDGSETKPKPKASSLLYYDPAGGRLQLINGDSAKRFALFRLMKCHYGDNQHIIDNPNHYKGHSNPVRKLIWQIWKSINRMEDINVTSRSIDLNLGEYVFLNQPGNTRAMSKQLTGCTCYFQAFLFGVLCKVGKPYVSVSGDDIGLDYGRSISFSNKEELGPVTRRICTFLLEFFAEDQPDEGGTLLMRPMTNNNFVLDFFRYKSSPYYHKMVDYLQKCGTEDRTTGYGDDYYEQQYRHVLQYYQETKCLHRYDKFSLGGATKSTANTKTLSFVLGTDGAAGKLARSDYYKFRAANFMFGFNVNVILNVDDFHEFNSLRKNQLLRFYQDIEPIVGDCREALQSARGATKYRDYCKCTGALCLCIFAFSNRS